MYKLKPNLFRLTTLIMVVSLFSACTPNPVVQNKEICTKQPKLEGCKQQDSNSGGRSYSGGGGYRGNYSQPHVSSPGSTGTKGTTSFKGRTGFGSFGRGGFGLG